MILWSPTRERHESLIVTNAIAELCQVERLTARCVR